MLLYSSNGRLLVLGKLQHPYTSLSLPAACIMENDAWNSTPNIFPPNISPLSLLFPWARARDLSPNTLIIQSPTLLVLIKTTRGLAFSCWKHNLPPTSLVHSHPFHPPSSQFIHTSPSVKSRSNNFCPHTWLSSSTRRKKRSKRPQGNEKEKSQIECLRLACALDSS